MQSYDEHADEWFEDGPPDGQHHMCTGLLTQEIQFLDGAFTQKPESRLTVNLKQYPYDPTFSASSHSSDTEDDGIIEADEAQNFGPLPDLPMSTLSPQNIINEKNIFTQCSQIVLSPPDSFQSTQKQSTNLVSDKLLNQFSDRRNSGLDLLLNARINSNVTHMLDLNKSGSSSRSWEKNSSPDIGKYEDIQIPSQPSVPVSPCLSEQYEALAYFNKSAENSNDKTILQLLQEKKLLNENSLVKSLAHSTEVLITISQSGVTSINENTAMMINQTMSNLNDKLSQESSSKQDGHLHKDQGGSNVGTSSCSWEETFSPTTGKYEDIKIISQQGVPASPCLSEQYETLADFNSNRSAENSNDKAISQLSQDKNILNENSLVKSPAHSTDIVITLSQSGVTSINENAAMMVNQTMSNLNDKLSKESSTKQDGHYKNQNGSIMGTSSCSWEEQISLNIGKYEDIQIPSQQSVPASTCLSGQYETLADFNSNSSAENSNDKAISQLSQEKKIFYENSLIKNSAHSTETLITISQSGVTSINENAAMMVNQTMSNLNDKLSQESSSKQGEHLDNDQDDSNITESIQPESAQENIEHSYVCIKKTEKERLFIHTAVQTDISSIGAEDCEYLLSKKRELDALHLEGPKRFKVKSLPLVLSDIGPNAFYATLTKKNDHENLVILNKNCNDQGHAQTAKNMDSKSRSIRLGLPRTVKKRLHKMKSKFQLFSYS